MYLSLSNWTSFGPLRQERQYCCLTVYLDHRDIFNEHAILMGKPSTEPIFAQSTYFPSWIPLHDRHYIKSKSDQVTIFPPAWPLPQTCLFPGFHPLTLFSRMFIGIWERHGDRHLPSATGGTELKLPPLMQLPLRGESLLPAPAVVKVPFGSRRSRMLSR